MNADNASSNDTQTAELSKLDNLFDADNHVHCFNHTLTLSGKTLIWPFNAGMGRAQCLLEGNSEGEHETETPPNDNEDEDINDADDRIDKMAELSADEQESLHVDTAVVREAVSKVCWPSNPDLSAH